jgi:hypothetical protein
MNLGNFSIFFRPEKFSKMTLLGLILCQESITRAFPKLDNASLALNQRKIDELYQKLVIASIHTIVSLNQGSVFKHSEMRAIDSPHKLALIAQQLGMKIRKKYQIIRFSLDYTAQN